MSSAAALSVLLATLAVGCMVGEPDDEVDTIEAGGKGIGIKDGKLVRGTNGFRPRGITVTGLALSPKAAAANPGTVYARAQKEIATDFATSLARYNDWGVNTLRFQVSQDGLDPQSPEYDASYLPFIIDALQEARAAGFIIILSMRESMPGQFTDQCGPDKLPCGVTRRAWKQLLAHPADIGHDRRYMLEIYNEPLSGVQNTDANWAIWKGPHQSLLDDVRAMGAVNVLIVDGIRAGKFLPTQPKFKLADRLGRVAYGIHPYPLLLTNLSYYKNSDWKAAFGDFCDGSVACIATEWATGTDVGCFDSTNNPDKVSSPVLAANMLKFLDARNIGSAVWPGDYPGSIVSDWAGSLTQWGTWDTFRCSNTTDKRGMGAMVRAYYRNGTLQ